MSVNSTVLAIWSAWKQVYDQATDSQTKAIALATLDALDIWDDGLVNGSIDGEIQDRPRPCSASTSSAPTCSASTSSAPTCSTPTSSAPNDSAPNDSAPTSTGDPHILSASAPPAIQKYKDEIEAASRETGVSADRIAAVMWAESRGNPDDPSRNIDGNMDVGLMQISQSTYDMVRGKQGGPELDVNDVAQNIRAGAWELRDKYNDNGNDWRSAHAAYRGMNDGQDLSYADAVESFYQALIKGETLPDDSGW